MIDGQKFLVIATGSEKADAYRLYKVKGDMAKFDRPDLPDLLANSIGTELIDITSETEANGMENKKTFKYGRGDAAGIQRVAWYVNESLLQKHPDYFPTEVELLEPNNYRGGNFYYSNYERKWKGKLAKCIVKIRWGIEGRSVSSWELRETAHRVFGGKSIADNGIYEAAKKQERCRLDDWRQRHESVYGVGSSPE